MKRVLITGGCGVIGTILKESWLSKYDITCLDARKSGIACIQCDITKLEDVSTFFEGQDVVVHLAGDSRTEAEWDSVYGNNILGTYNVFEAARKANVKKLVFASSNHVTGLYEKEWPISAIVKGEYEGLDCSKIPMVSDVSPQKTDSYYGAGKLFGEGLGRYYSSEFGISVICLRIGTVRPYEWPQPHEIRFFATWLSHRDLVQLFEKSIETGTIQFGVYYGVSNNKWRFWDIGNARKEIGYDPQDDAEDRRKN
jgi:NAD+ dependent glucose-6-phosphate dehydrogenase